MGFFVFQKLSYASVLVFVGGLGVSLHLCLRNLNVFPPEIYWDLSTRTLLDLIISSRKSTPTVSRIPVAPHHALSCLLYRNACWADSGFYG
jgi:hypothetical protein